MYTCQTVCSLLQPETNKLGHDLKFQQKVWLEASLLAKLFIYLHIVTNLKNMCLRKCYELGLISPQDHATSAPNDFLNHLF